MKDVIVSFLYKIETPCKTKKEALEYAMNFELPHGYIEDTFEVEIVENREEKKTLQQLWHELGDIPVNDNKEETIDIDFYFWKKGTPRLEIWHWFDKESNGSLPPRN